MKSLFALSTLLAAAASALGQAILISVPASGATLSAGQTFVIEVDNPPQSTDFTNGGIALAIKSCPSSTTCSDDNDELLLNPFFIGPYSPQRHEVFKPPYQNFTVTVPSTLSSGPAQLTVASFNVVGASKDAVLDFFTLSVTID